MKEPVTLTTKKLKKMSLTHLRLIADSYAERLLWLHSVGKTEEPKYLQMMKELYHVSAIIDEKEATPKFKDYGKSI